MLLLLLLSLLVSLNHFVPWQIFGFSSLDSARATFLVEILLIAILKLVVKNGSVMQHEAI